MKHIFLQPIINNNPIEQILKAFLNFLALISFIAMFTGCIASFPQGELGKIYYEPLLTKGNNPTSFSVEVRVSGRLVLNGKEMDDSLRKLEKMRRSTLESYENSRLFTGVSERNNQAKIVAKVNYYIDTISHTFPGALNGVFLIPGIVLWPIPSKISEIYTLNTTFIDSEGNELGTVEQKESVNTWMHGIMYFFAPFNWPTKVESDVYSALNNATLAEAVERKLLYIGGDE